MSYTPVTDRPLTAQEYWDNPPIKIGERLQGYKNSYTRKTDLLSMLDFAECYADYICDYEKSFDYQRK